MCASSSRNIRTAGFTLVEVLVALAIVAIALAAGARATQALTDTAQRQVDTLLAQICAENELAQVRLRRQLPGVGDRQTPCDQGGRTLTVQLQVRPTPNPLFRRVEAQVLDGDASLLRLSTVVGQF
ncbi:MAG: hypothetical protein RLZZ126_1253 [Pseudomonadota bacterium]|jgi:general secretion pathway protein I